MQLSFEVADLKAMFIDINKTLGKAFDPSLADSKPLAQQP